jgi:hypothetical protein
MEARRLEEVDEEELKPLRRGWCLGSEQFRQEMLERMDGKLGESHSGELHRETAEQRANHILAEELSRRGWTESDLAARRRSDPGKLAIAVRLRNETTLPVKWIAPRVQIATAKGAKSLLHRSRRSPPPTQTHTGRPTMRTTGIPMGDPFRESPTPSPWPSPPPAVSLFFLASVAPCAESCAMIKAVASNSAFLGQYAHRPKTFRLNN